jgi:hypothetical protein
MVRSSSRSSSERRLRGRSWSCACTSVEAFHSCEVVRTVAVGYARRGRRRVRVGVATTLSAGASALTGPEAARGRCRHGGTGSGHLGQLRLDVRHVQ